MIDAIRKGPLRSLAPVQWVVVGLVLIVLLFLAIGTAVESSAPPPQFAFGLQRESFAVLALLSFLAGLLSFASPCTLPILPAYFAFAFQSGRKHIALNTMIFMLGLGTMFSLLGATASALGRVLNQNQQLILLLGGALVLGFGVMSLLGKGFGGLAQSEGQAPPSRTLGGTYLFGLTFAVGWSSCVGPILGTVLTMAGTTGSVLRGVMLGFIYTLGLGLPLIVVSTFFGRASRQSLFWRLLRGKGWDVTVPVFVVGLVWALAVWRVLVAVANYAYRHINLLAGQELTTAHSAGLLLIAILGVALWIATGPAERRVTLHLHSTQLISGALFVLMGVLILDGRLAAFNSLASTDLALWLIGLEERVVNYLTAR